jgi:DNA-binding transcriptional LysR family regulator
MAIDQQDYYNFYNVARYLSFTKAAQALNRSKSYISKSISSLEVQLQTKLIQRTTNNLTLTQAGERLFQTVTAMQVTLESGLESLQTINQVPMGRLNISAPPALAESVLAPALALFSKKYPHITMQINCESRLVHVIDDGFDIIFRSAILEDANFIARPLLSCGYSCVANIAAKEKISHLKHPNDLTTLPCFAYGKSGVAQWTFEKEQETITVPLQPIFYSNLSSMIKSFLMLSEGIAVLPNFVVQEDLKEGRLLPVLPTWDMMESPVYMVYPSRHYMPLKLKCFIDFMLQYHWTTIDS